MFSVTIVISVVVSILGKAKYFKAAQLRLIQMESRDIFLETKKKREKERKKEKNGRKEEKRKYHVYKQKYLNNLLLLALFSLFLALTFLSFSKKLVSTSSKTCYIQRTTTDS